MKLTLVLISAFALSGCLKLQDLLKLAPTPAEICAMSPDTQIALADTMNTTVAALTAACEIVQ